MSFGAAQVNTAPTPITSLVEDSGNIRARLRELHERLTSLGSSLHGADPREVDKPGEPDPPPSVRGNIDHSKRMLGRIEDELQRIAERV